MLVLGAGGFASNQDWLRVVRGMPDGKFAHSVHRSAALPKWTIAKRQPGKVTMSAD
ncbi:MAG: hypothetical protein U1E86_00465 [Burkholderiaceae bacterium]